MKYGVDRELYYKDDTVIENGQTARYQRYYMGAYEKVIRTGGHSNMVEHKYNIAGAVITYHDGNRVTSFVHTDNQGSVVATTNYLGVVQTQALYEPFGTQSIVYEVPVYGTNNYGPITEKGYTGHRHMDHVGIIHMNGRIYDPTLGRFLQADLFIQAPKNSQSYNRYAYVLNSPLSLTDPSGYFWDKISKPFKKVGRNIIRGVSKALGDNFTHYLGQVGSAFCGPWAPACSAAWTYEFNRAHGNTSTGSLRAAAVAGTMTYINGPQQFNVQGAVVAAGIVDPDVGRVMNFLYNGVDYQNFNWQDSAAALGNEVKGYYVSKEVERFASKNGMTLSELNALLTLTSMAGNEIAGSRYKGSNDGVEYIAGMGRRRGGYATWVVGGYNLAGAIFDVVDIALGYQGLLTASASEYVKYGNPNNKLLGFSLGALDVNNLVSRGYGQSGSLAVSLPFGNIGQAAVVNGTLDPINGGYLGWLFSPNAKWEEQGFSCHRRHCYDALKAYRGEL